METKNPKMVMSDQVVWSLEDDLSGSGQAKSYICSFCKKGFSNAQALGGHMNIHRKDRAKLRESSEENMLSSDNVKKTNPIHHDPSRVSEMVLESSQDKSLSSLKRPCKLYKEDDVGASANPRGKEAIEELKQLPFFAAGDDIRTSGDNEEESHGSSSQMELDLELRLGPEPHQGTSIKNTREFF